MALKRLMNNFKTILSSEENKLEDLKFVAYELASLFKTTPMSEPEGLSPQEIYDELCLLPDDPDYTDNARKVKMYDYKKKLLEIINIIIESTKSNKTIKFPPQRKFLTKIRASSLEIIFELVNFFKFKASGTSVESVRKVYKAFYVALLFVLGLVVLFMIKPSISSPPSPTNDYKIIAETLIKDYTSKLEFYNQKNALLDDKMHKWASANYRKKCEIQSEIIAIKVKVDSLTRVILPHLYFIKNKIIDSADRSKINAYMQIHKNY